MDAARLEARALRELAQDEERTRSRERAAACVQEELRAVAAIEMWATEREVAPNAETDTASNVSRVQQSYEQAGGMGGISIEIMDAASNQQMIVPLRELLKVSGTSTSASGTQKVIKIGGHAASEEWASDVKNGSVGVLVADRFLVNVTGSTVDSVEVIHKFVQAIDLNKLAALK